MLRRYWRAGVLFYALIQFALLGTSPKGLAIARLSIQHKINKKLRKDYAGLLHAPIEAPPAADSPPGPIWICWWQGLDAAPDIVRACFESAKAHRSGRDIRFVTRENYREFVDFPEHVIQKWDAGIISNTHMSDMLRVELLVRHGGIWMDATVMLSGDIPDDILDAVFFCFRQLSPAGRGAVLDLSNWVLAAKPGQPLLILVRKLLYAYWERNTALIDYFWSHHFISIAKDRYPKTWREMPLYNSSDPHILKSLLCEPCDRKVLQHIYSKSAIHKLSYKYKSEQLEKPGTYYQYLVGSQSNVDEASVFQHRH
jgi:hypothetical protein